MVVFRLWANRETGWKVSAAPQDRMHSYLQHSMNDFRVDWFPLRMRGRTCLAQGGQGQGSGAQRETPLQADKAKQRYGSAGCVPPPASNAKSLPAALSESFAAASRCAQSASAARLRGKGC